MEKFGCAGVVPGCGICSQGESHSWDHSHPSMGMEGMQGKGIRHCPGPTKAHRLALGDCSSSLNTFPHVQGVLMAPWASRWRKGAPLCAFQSLDSHQAAEPPIPCLKVQGSALGAMWPVRLSQLLPYQPEVT